jgi:hypothetical protein
LQELPAVVAEGMESMMPIMRKSIDRIAESAQQEVAQNVEGLAKEAGRRRSARTKLTSRHLDHT